jgi:hypothetical protein
MDFTSHVIAFSPDGAFFVGATVVVVAPTVVTTTDAAGVVESATDEVDPHAASKRMRNAGTRRFTPPVCW